MFGRGVPEEFDSQSIVMILARDSNWIFAAGTMTSKVGLRHCWNLHGHIGKNEKI